MPTGTIATSPKFQFLDSNGNPLAGGTLTTYLAGTTTPETTWQDQALTVTNTNPITLDSRGECVLWLDSAKEYKFILENAVGVSQWTQDDVSGAQSVAGLTGIFTKFTDLAASSGSSLVGYLPEGVGAVATTLQSKIRESVSVLDFGADLTGAEDSGPAFRAAVASITPAGGSVYIPAGTYKVQGAIGDASNTAVFVPSYVRLIGASQGGTKVVPGANNVVCFRFIGLNGGLENLQIDNPGTVFSNVSGIRLAPIDETQLITRSDVEFNVVTNVSIRRLQEGLVLKCGPTVAGADSYCYYNTFTNIDIRNTTIGVWLKVPNSTLGSGCNRNRFISVRVGETGCNTGLQIDAGDTCQFIACSFEGIQAGTSPNTVPTAVKIAYNTLSYGCVRNQFFGLVIEGCTRDVDNDNDLTEFYGWFGTGTYYSPSSRPLAVNFTASKQEALALVATNELSRGRTATQVVDLALTANGQTILMEDGGEFANQSFILRLSKGGGASGIIELKYGSGVLLGWGGVASSYAGGASLINPSDGVLSLGQNQVARAAIDTSGNFYPAVDNAYSCGKSGNRWSAVWAVNGTIQTSDERQKNNIKPSDLGLDFINALNPVSYRWNIGQNVVTVTETGDDADGLAPKSVIITPREGVRTHYGLLAQQVKMVLGAKDFAGFVHDKETDEMGLRYDQFISPLIRAVQELSMRVAALEAKLP